MDRLVGILLCQVLFSSFRLSSSLSLSLFRGGGVGGSESWEEYRATDSGLELLELTGFMFPVFFFGGGGGGGD
jgi:succinate dehydrogenase/fumarate reductase cytochrome b subunit